MNLNQLAKNVCKREGGKVNLPIAQVKEVIRCMAIELTTMDMSELGDTFSRFAKIAKKARSTKR